MSQTLFEEVHILLVEDSVSDVEFIREALQEIGYPHRLDVIDNGESAMTVLQGMTERPHLILLDLNLPKVSGLDVLRMVKHDPQLRVIPTIVLSNSTSQEDIMACYANHANAYLRKPMGFADLVVTLKATWAFWFHHQVMLPLPYSYITGPHSLTPPESEE